jgi:hypothetical protein
MFTRKVLDVRQQQMVSQKCSYELALDTLRKRRVSFFVAA